ncbi:MAG: Spy/CpxP family protein refolding chaperone [Nitrospinota bacterium]|nr:Spy/CpxP family protein refolding chaperone [Nitrospinota bacterium]
MTKENQFMNSTCKALLFVFLTAAFTLGATIAQATGDEHSPGGGKVCVVAYSGGGDHESHESTTPGESARHIKKVLKHAVDIGLDDSQQKAVGDIYIKAKAEEASIGAETEVTISDYMTLYKQRKVTETAIEDYARKMGDLRGRFLLNNLKAMNDVKGVLTKEQRSKIHEIYKTHGKGGKK